MAGIYHNATLGVISLSSDGESWITIADKNLGATQVYNDGDELSEANCGKYYQWGNNYGFPRTGTITTSTAQVNAQNYGPGNYYNSSTFIVRTSNPRGWDSSYNHNLWGNTTDTNEARRGPCNEGYHIPKASEVTDLLNIRTELGFGVGTGAYTDFCKYLKIPLSGIRIGSSALGPTAGQGTHGRFWTSSTGYDNDRASSLYFANNSISVLDTDVRSNGLSIRPFKNEPVIPDYNDTWDTLYGDELPDRPIPPLPKLKRIVKHNNYYYFGDKPVHASGITLNKNSISLNEAGQTYQLTATVSPDDAVDKKVHWSSSDITIATVSSNGLVTCVTPGSCTITATCDGISASCSVAGTVIEFLLIGGGGGGAWIYDGYGCNGGGGGGAGGLIYCEGYELINNSYNVVIGAGGCGKNGNGDSGCNSCFGDIVAYGGGGGAYGTNSGASGGSGGGGGGKGGLGGVGCSGQGNNGGTGGYLCQYNCRGGGGGGAGGPARCSGSYTIASVGGLGLDYDIDGQTHTYATGGDAERGVQYGTNASVYGGGGGGGQYNGSASYYRGGHGCQGIFILRYPTDYGYDITGGTKYTCGDYTIHCFTSDGTLTIN